MHANNTLLWLASVILVRSIILGNSCLAYPTLDFTVSPVAPVPLAYSPHSPEAPCTCNVIAYNVMAACVYFQDLTAQSWGREENWMKLCTIHLDTSYSYTGIPANVSTSGLAIPQWAR